MSALKNILDDVDEVDLTPMIDVTFLLLIYFMVTTMLKGMTLDEAQEIKNTTIVEELALPPVKIHCSVLAEDAIKAAVRDYGDKKQKINAKPVEI